MSLAGEREASGVDPLALSIALYGSGLEVELRQRLSSLWFSDAVVKCWPKITSPFLNRAAQFERGLRLSRRLIEICSSNNLNPAEFELLKVIANEHTPFAVHDTVFVPALETLASASQQAEDEILLRARTWAISGSFAQTEMGHGSNVRGLETTAKYLPDEDVFVLDTPVPSATKWWVGGLGVTATHAVIVAQLIMEDGSRKGIHGFLARIREPSGDTWTLAPNVEAGDIGPKFGFAAVDNGFARFSSLRVPRANMLSAAAHIERVQDAAGNWRGIYVSEASAASDSAAYKSLVAARIIVSRLAYVTLSHAITISIRYAARRSQFRHSGHVSESILLNYPSHQRRLFPVLATTFALKVLAEATPDLLAEASSSATDPAGASKAVHVLSSSLKVYATEAVSAALEECRRACGGQGYSLSSGLPQLLAMFVHLVTAEGDNTVMCQQAGRGLASGVWRACDADIGKLDELQELGSPASEETRVLCFNAFDRVLAPGGGCATWTGAGRLLQVSMVGSSTCGAAGNSRGLL